MHLVRFFFNQNWNCGIAQVEGRMVRDAILNINTYFVAYVDVIGFSSSVVRREFRNLKFPGSNPAPPLKVSFFFFFLSFFFFISQNY